jgi:thiol-disulfide isomerase/thioredoxin
MNRQSSSWLFMSRSTRYPKNVMLAKYLLSIILLLASTMSQAQESTVIKPQWTEPTPNGTMVTLWFFWSQKCPHCRDAHPHIEKLPEQLPWVKLKSYRLDGHPENVAIYQWIAGELGQQARSVPAFIFCGEMHVGWDSEGMVKQALVDGLNRCRNGQTTKQTATQQAVKLPLLGEFNPEKWPIAVFTIAIAGMDSFNPCAFFVLMFLLSLLVHAGSKTRMFMIGSFFILVSGMVYFASMAAWLNLFSVVGHLALVTTIAGTIAVTIAVINIKDYFLFKQGVSLSISDKQRSKLMRRMRELISADSLPTMLAATFTLAIFANLYELLCTAGFPMVYTRYLTLNQLPTIEYYLYLLLYNVIYVIPLLLIMVIFVMTFGQRKLQENEGRVLKLLSGLMMLALGAVLILDPELLNRVDFAITLLLGVIIATWLITKLKPFNHSES